MTDRARGLRLAHVFAELSQLGVIFTSLSIGFAVASFNGAMHARTAGALCAVASLCALGVFLAGSYYSMSATDAAKRER